MGIRQRYPELPERMLCLIAPDSQYILQHEELLTKPDTPTEEPSKEIFNCSSSPEEEEVEKSWSLETEAAGGEGVLKITNSPENKTEHDESQQIHDAGIRHEFDIHQEKEHEHYEESHIAGGTHEDTEGQPYEETHFAGTTNEATEVIHHDESRVAEKTDVDEEVTSSIHLNSESENEEEVEISTDRDQGTDQGNLDENVFFTSGGDDSGTLKVAPKSSKAKSNPIISKTAADVFAAGILEGTSVVPNIPETPMNQENLEAVPENVYKACKRNPVEEKLDMLLSEIQGQRADKKTLSESVEVIKTQPERNTEALKSLQKLKEKAPETNISASKIQKILTEIEKIKTQVANTVESRQSSSTNKVLEEVTILRARNNSITDAFEKLSKEWAAMQMKAQTEFTKV
ncbi:uncharacterized protein LOC110900864 [Helianthus annuus]|uniref:uncharacterized protein LOC110900864 n=1 Tax=Helianthus annuus TaxID=4232 RepID=UPI000B904584|nr:uncharacterized protein LOC110900864 [Helianthus annuus]